MDFLKDSVSIHGVMEVISKVILSKVIETDMEYGVMLLQVDKVIKDTICSIKSMDMVFMIGETAICTKEISFKINEMERGSSSIISNLPMMDIGTVDNDVIKMNSKLFKVI